MIKNFFLITIRSMAKNKVFLFINVLGMGVAIACCIVAYFAYEMDANFDKMYKNGDQIYRVSSLREFEGNVNKFGTVPLPLAGIVKQNISDVAASTRYYFSWSNFKRENDLFTSKLAYVDPAFFDLFAFDFVVGSPAAIADKKSVVISEAMAIRLFGSAAEAFGKNIAQVYGQETKEIKIAGVIKDIPQNSSFHNKESFMHFDNALDEHKDLNENDWRKETTLFLKVSDPSRLSQINEQIQPFVLNNNQVREDFIIKNFTLDKFATMAATDRVSEVRTWTWDAFPISAIIGSSIMGILILLIACFNLTNTAIAISSRRLKEIGIRKVMGSVRRQLIFQFIGETTFVCFVSLIIGLALADVLINGWNSLWEYMRLTPHYLDNTSFLFFAFIVLLFTGILAGGYPAFYISKFEPISILKGKLKFGGTNNFTRVLLGLQFAISLISIVSAIAFYQNARFQEQYDLGFNIRGSVIAWVASKEEFAVYRNAISSNTDIVSVAGASSGIYSNRIHEPVKHDSRQLEVDIIDVGDNYLKTLNLSLTQGRDFIKDSETDKRESVIISQKMADMFGWDKPLGKEVIWKDTARYYVVGVVKDVYTLGLWRELEPLMIRYIGEDQYSQIVVSANANNVANVNRFMEEKWKEVFPNRLYTGRMLALDFKEIVDVNNNILIMYAFLGIIAMFLSVTGLFSLVSLNIIKRMKEIGVRKVLGASIGNITRIINTEFVVTLLVASILGCSLSFYAVDALMGSIWHYYKAASLSTFVVAVASMLIVSFVAIGYKVYAAASINPVNTLRDE